MSEDLNTEIKISANADGVEAGVSRAKRSLASLSQEAERAGDRGAAGLGRMGAGGDLLGRRMDSVTKNVQASLQRQIAALEAGGTATRQYQETIARMRGADLNALKPWLDQLDAAKAKAEAAGKAQGGLVDRLSAIGPVASIARGQIAALMGSFTAATIFTFIKGVNDGVDALNDIKDATGSTIENISALEDVGRRTGASFETVGSILIKFNDVLSKATPKSEIALALKAIGLEATALKEVDPAEALRLTAVALAGYADDANKARLIQDLFGKSVKDAAPFLADLAEKGSLVAKVTSEQADEADRFNKELFNLQTNANEAARGLAGPMVKAINEVAKAFRDGSAAGKGFWDIAWDRYQDANKQRWEMVRNGLGDVGNAQVNMLRGAVGMPPVQRVVAAPNAGGATGDWGPPANEPGKPSIVTPKTAAEIAAEAAATKAALTDALAAQMEVYKAHDKALLDSRKAFQDQMAALAKQGTLGEMDVIEQTAAKEEEIWAQRRANFQAEIAFASKKQNSAAEVARITSQMQDAERDYLQSVAKSRADAQQAELKYSEALEGRIAAYEKSARAAQEQLRTATLEGQTIGVTGAALGELTKARMEDSARELERQAVTMDGIDLSGRAGEALRAQAQAMRDAYKVNGNNSAAQAVYEYGKAIREQNDAISFELSLMGLSEQARETAMEQYRIEIGLLKQIEDIKARTAADPARRDELIASARADAAIAKANASSKVFLQEWKESVKQYDDIFRQGFADMLNGGEGAWKSFTRSLVTTFKTSVADQIYKMFLQPFVVRVVGQFMGMSGGGGVAGQGGLMGSLSGSGGGLTNWPSWGTDGADALWNNGARLINSGFEDVGGAMMDFGRTVGQVDAYLRELPGMSGGIGSAAGYIGAIYSLTQGKPGAAIGQAIGTYILPGIGTMIGGMLGGLLDGLDGSGDYHRGGTVSWSAARGMRYGRDYLDDQENTPGYNRADSIDDQFGTGMGYTIDDEGIRQSVSGIAALIGGTLDAMSRAFGGKGGFEVATGWVDDFDGEGDSWGGLRITDNGKELLNWNDNRPNKWGPRMFGAGEDGYKEYLAAVAKDTRQVLLDMDLPGWADQMLTAIGESASIEELGNVLNQIGVIKNAFTGLGRSMEMFSGLSDDMQSALLQAAGSVDALVSNAGTFYQGFYSEAERMEALRSQLQGALDDLDISVDPAMGDAAKEQFRTAVEAAFASGNAALANSLLALGGSFASAADYFEQLAEETARIEAERQRKLADTRAGLDERLLAAQGNDRGVLDLRRKQEYDALYKLDPALAELVAKIYALEDASKAAAEAAARAAEIESKGFDLTQRLLIAEGRDREALDLRRAQEYDALWKLDPALAAMVARIYELEDAAQRAADAEAARGNAMRDLADAMGRQREVWEGQLEALNTQRQVQQEALGLITGIFDLVRSNARDLYGEVGATAAMQASQGNAFIAQALATAKRTGYLPEQDALQQAISAARGGLDSSQYKTQVDADFARLVLAGQLKGLEDIAGPQKTAAEQQIERLDAQAEYLQRLIREQQKEYDLLQRQVDIANGTYNATITVAEATAKIIELLGGKKPAGNADDNGGAVFGGTAPSPAGTGSGAKPAPAKYSRMYWIGGADAGYEGITDQSLIDRLDKLAPVYHSFDGTGDLVGLGEAFKQAGGTIADLSILSGNWEGDWRKAFAAVGIPAFAMGTNYVPYDTPAVVHKGERIIPAADNRALMAAVNAGGQGNTARLEALVQQLVEDNRLQAGEILRLQNRLAKVIEKWDGDGLPQERDEAVTA